MDIEKRTGRLTLGVIKVPGEFPVWGNLDLDLGGEYLRILKLAPWERDKYPGFPGHAHWKGLAFLDPEEWTE